MEQTSLRGVGATGRRHLHALQEHAGDGAEVSPELVTALEELSVSMEELQATEEELRAQNEQLRGAQHAIDEERRRYLDLFELAPDGYLVTDAEAVIQEANQAMAGMLKVSEETLEGKPLLVFVPEEERREFHTRLTQLLQSGPGTKRVSWMINLRPRKGNAFPAAATIGITRDGQHQISSLRWLLRDITERREAEERLVAYQEQLQSLTSELTLAEERERRNIASGIHDQVIQNLAVAAIRLDSVKSLIGPPDLRHEIVQVREALRSVVADLRNLTFDLSPPILYELGLEAALQYLAERFQARHGITVELKNDSGDDALSEEVRLTLFRSVGELLTNVIKHGHASRVTVGMSAVEDQVRVCVEDNGQGFDPSQLDTRRAGELGFGLFSIRERIRFLGGRLLLESEPGRGTRVTLEAPRRERE
ncbi:MAG: PAS domain S-box protein [Candidatus Hydrogenedentes bacterium]|nr:PAS domain S-box protein [Candidatus Hydrogenedentota bacterium]